MELCKLLVRLIERRFDRLLQKELEYHRGLPNPNGWTGHRSRWPRHHLVRRLRKRNESELRFVHDLRLPFTNN